MFHSIFLIFAKNSYKSNYFQDSFISVIAQEIQFVFWNETSFGLCKEQSGIHINLFEQLRVSLVLFVLDFFRDDRFGSKLKI